MRPRVHPALPRVDRDERTLQLGAHPGRAVVLTGLSRAARRWLDRLDGVRDLAGALREARSAGLPEVAARDLLDQLGRSGVLDDAGGPALPLPLAELDRMRPDLDAMDLVGAAPGGGRESLLRRARSRVRVYGAGRVGAQVVALLAAGGVGGIRVFDPEPTRPRDLVPGGLTWAEVGMPRQDGAVAVAARLAHPGEGGEVTEVARGGEGRDGPRPARSGGGKRSRAGDGEGRAAGAGDGGGRAAGAGAGGAAAGQRRAVSGLGERAVVEVRAGGPYLGDGTERPDLVILTPVRPLDMVLVNELTALGIPHLLGSAFEGHGSAGPLVVPGQTACLHCLDLTRRDHDPAWPLVTAGLGGYPPGEIACDASLAASVAAAVAGHALNFLDGHASAVTNGTTDISPDRHWKHRSWTIHPQCRCIRTYPYPLTMVMSATCDSQAQVTTDEGGKRHLG
ncbi:thiamine biosynthesis protein ThiF [Nonomuraea sp. NPDC049486]|uniref:thiamine biosynthesis protein ThiF n=1 Tax=Nonomuraea sp. NPDC049486 TaxID=3155773 RepID=UPI00341B5241